jgi:hypothetical protein
LSGFFFAVRTIAGGAWVARRGDLVGQGVDEIVGVEVGLHQRQIFFGLCGRQSHMQPTGEFLQLFDGRTFNSHGVPFIWCLSMQPVFNISPKCHHYMAVRVSHLAEMDTRRLWVGVPG